MAKMILPTKEQLDLINDLEYLSRLQEDIDWGIEKIKVDLDHADGDDEWHQRAKSALVAYKIAKKNVQSRIWKLTKGSTDRAEAAIELNQIKLTKAEKSAQKLNAHALVIEKQNKNRELKIRQLAIDAKRRQIDVIKKVSFCNHFSRVAKDVLDSETYSKIHRQAARDHLESISNLLLGLGGEECEEYHEEMEING